jgi:hypothetical protein
MVGRSTLELMARADLHRLPRGSYACDEAGPRPGRFQGATAFFMAVLSVPGMADGRVCLGLAGALRGSRNLADYSMTRLARSTNDGDSFNPSSLAVLALITKSICVGCSTGRSEGFAPFKILTT